MHRIARLVVMAVMAVSAIAAVASPKIEAKRSDQARLTVPVYVNGQGPFFFLVDTAATASVVSLELVRKLSLPSAGFVQLQDVQVRSRVPIALVDRLRIGDLVVPGLKMPMLKAEDIGADGIVGADIFQDQQVSIDGKRRAIVINADRKATQPGRWATDRVVADPHRLQMFVTDADIDGNPIVVVVDSGSSTSVINGPARRMLGPNAIEIAGVRSTLIGVTGAELPVVAVNLRQARIGNFIFRDAPVAVADLAIFSRLGLSRKPALLLGMNLLARFDRVDLDFKHKRIDFSVQPDVEQMAMKARFMPQPIPPRAGPPIFIPPPSSVSAPAAAPHR